MELKKYFDEHAGFGVLATADAKGAVNAAVYGRPHFEEADDVLLFIMRDRLSHANLQKNPAAAYLFREEGEGYRGKRLALTKIGEEKDSPRIEEIRRRRHEASGEDAGSKYLVRFRVDKIRPLVGERE
ncbi:MAG: pyridoxamine 5'-phosphate oxidase family protein [Syntrophales bacterium]|jgi:hypothetical protein|nr:pyridoxamine 5'-phosphate oxidase family protein [Syntrophales bacterium]